MLEKKGGVTQRASVSLFKVPTEGVLDVGRGQDWVSGSVRPLWSEMPGCKCRTALGFGLLFSQWVSVQLAQTLL